MLNLLPKEQKSKISSEYRMRVLVVACMLFLAAEIISLILLVPPYLIASTRINILNSQSATVKAQNVAAETAQLSTTIQKTSDYISVFTSSTTPTGVLRAINTVIAALDPSVRINSLTYGAQNIEQQVIVGGTASSRQALLDFMKKIKIQPGVISADLPVSDFAKSTNIPFSLTVLINPQQI